MTQNNIAWRWLPKSVAHTIIAGWLLSLLSAQTVHGAGICDNVPTHPKPAQVRFVLPATGSVGWINGRTGNIPFQWGLHLRPGAMVNNTLEFGAEGTYLYLNPTDELFVGPRLTYAFGQTDLVPMVNAFSCSFSAGFLFGNHGEKLLSLGLELNLGDLIRTGIGHDWATGGSGSGEGFNAFSLGADLVAFFPQHSTTSVDNGNGSGDVRSYYTVLTTESRFRLLATIGASPVDRKHWHDLLSSFTFEGSSLAELKLALSHSGELTPLIAAVDEACKNARENVEIRGSGLTMPTPIDETASVGAILKGWCQAISSN